MEKTKTNKKSKSLIVMLVAILLCIAIVLGMGGFTYAKYISSKSVSTQTAQVAKWGWQIGADSSKLFSTKYDSNGAAIKSGDTSASIGVAASASDSLIVAPGTKGSMKFWVTGSAEVRSAITVSATAGTYVQLTTVSYEPIVWKLYSATSDLDVDANDWTVVSGWENGKSYSDMISGLGEIKESDIAPATTKDLYYKLSWEWPFETGNDDTAKATNNLYDTILGAMMAYDTNAEEDDEDANVFWGPEGQKIVPSSTTAATVYTTTTSTDDEGNVTTSTETKEYTATTSVSLNLTITVTQIQTASN